MNDEIEKIRFEELSEKQKIVCVSELGRDRECELADESAHRFYRQGMWLGWWLVREVRARVWERGRWIRDPGSES